LAAGLVCEETVTHADTPTTRSEASNLNLFMVADSTSESADAP
jgi:hypothetical protein